jgi:hypothetical protein
MRALLRALPAGWPPQPPPEPPWRIAHERGESAAALTLRARRACHPAGKAALTVISGVSGNKHPLPPRLPGRLKAGCPAGAAEWRFPHISTFSHLQRRRQRRRPRRVRELLPRRLPPLTSPSPSTVSDPLPGPGRERGKGGREGEGGREGGREVSTEGGKEGEI